jgi:seryl-tRNA(Sec) selenium transferase
MGVYARLGVRTVVNARGCATLAGGTLMPPEVVAAMEEASRSFVRIGDLQDAASAMIAELTGAEAGYVTSGAAAGMTLGTAAMIARLDLDLMDRLPVTGTAPAEVIVQAAHRNPYDHLVRAAGARLVEFGTAGGATTAEMAASLGPATAGAFFNAQAEQGGLSIDEFVETAHNHNVPVLVDASTNLPPRANLRRYVAAGADLVAFSGGKTIRGPQASGFLAGRADLILSVGLQHQDMDVLAATWARRSLLESGLIPRPPLHGIGRSMKTGKEEIVGLLAALERYAALDEAVEARRWATQAERLAAGLAGVPGLAVRTEAAQADGRPVPMVVVTVDPVAFELTAVELVGRLAARDPIIMVGDHDAEAGILRLDPENLDVAGVDEVIAAFRAGGA